MTFETHYDKTLKHAYCNGLKFTRDEKSGYFLCASIIGGKRPRLHRYIYESARGKIPSGMHVHHIDGDKNNNALSNLSILGGGEHSSLHGKEPQRAAESRKHIKSAIIAAPTWHKSNMGRRWHKEHYDKIGWKLHERVEKICVFCSKPFWGTKGNSSKFCSNACKSAYRRKEGVDNEKRTCAVCGAGFEADKYSKTKTCSRKCSARLCQNYRNSQATAT